MKDVDLSFPRKDKLYEKIDALPRGVAWHCKEIEQKGDLKDADGKALAEKLELWF